jgi:hypothetical protein
MLPGKGGSIIQALKSWCDLGRCGKLPTLLCFIVIALLSIAADHCFPVAKDKGKAVDNSAAPAPERPRLEELVRSLAAPEMEGRRGEGGRKAAAFLIEEFQRLKLKPLFDGAYVQEIPAAEQGRIQGRNVGAVLPGQDPELRGQWIIVSAHFDHLGKRGAVVYPGADDNASGVAMMLEVARSTSMAPQRPRRSLMFIGFDLEELGLFGSRYFVAHPPVPLEQIALFITADMIGRALAGVCRDQVFILGTEHAPGLRSWLAQAATDQPLKLGMLGSDLLILNRSDYGPFRTRRVPYLFFSTGENPCYHSPEDKPETLNYSKLTAISRVIHRVVATAAEAPAVPRWTDAPDHPLAEAITLRDVISTLLENQKTLELGSASTFVMKSTLKSLEEIIARGAITQAERARVIQAARLVLLMIH